MVFQNLFQQILRNTIYYLFYSCGLIYTTILIASNVKSYYNFSSQLIQTEMSNIQDEVFLKT